MTSKQIKKELEKIYQERRSWQGGNGPFDRLSVNRRESVLCKQKEPFYLELYKIIENYRRD